MSLAEILGTTLETIPAEVPYVFADEALTKPGGNAWRSTRASRWDRLAGQPQVRRRPAAIDPAATLRPFAAVPGVRLFSLQKGAGAEQIAEVAAVCPVVDFGPDFDTEHGTFMDTAAVIRNLDLVITSDTAVAHLAGALGVPVWVALGYSCDWRWLDEREDSPWYPTMRLFRQRGWGTGT